MNEGVPKILTQFGEKNEFNTFKQKNEHAWADLSIYWPGDWLIDILLDPGAQGRLVSNQLVAK